MNRSERPRGAGDARRPLEGVCFLLFARSPRPGRVKTRLVPPLNPVEAAALHLAFVEDQLRFLSGFAQEGASVVLYVDEPFRPEGELENLLADIPVETQGSGDLGERMLRAVRRSAARGSRATALVAADAPAMPPDSLREAVRALEADFDAGLVPAEDGGYVLLALREPLEPLFRDIPWGGPEVLDRTRRRAQESGIRLFETEATYDVDDAASLRRLWEEPELSRRSPSTARALARLDLRRIGVL